MRRGFTVIELMVTIGIIVVLVGLTVSVTSSLALRSELTRTQNTLRLLDMAVQEWELTADRKLTWGPAGSGATFDIDEETPLEMILPVILERILHVESVRSVFNQIDPRLIVRFDDGSPPPLWLEGDYDPIDYGKLTVVDAWGTPLYALHPGAIAGVPGPGSIVDPDGTERTQNEQYFGVAVNRQICLIAFGPDGEEGRLMAPAESLLYQQAADNLYSYAIEKP